MKDVGQSLRILVTGGAGFIGSALVRHIVVETTHKVLNVDKLTYASDLAACEPVQSNPRYAFAKADICDFEKISLLFESFQPDLIMHLAAESHVDRSIETPAIFLQTNIVGTSIMLSAALDYYRALSSKRRERFRFHHVSTDEVYGDLPHPDDLLSSSEADLPRFTESSPYSPSSPYSASKASSDHLVRAWHRTYGLPTVITNCSNNYGPFQCGEKLIPKLIVNAAQNKPLPMYGNGTQIRDWLYVDDHVRALLECATKGGVGETYNIGGGNEYRNIEVANQICEMIDAQMPSPNSRKSLIEFIPDRPGHDRRYAIDQKKIMRDLGWRPSESFESGLKKTVSWYLKKLKDSPDLRSKH